ncbi:MAG: amino acid--tRNA ligase-related protein [Microgenomates group bacterium]
MPKASTTDMRTKIGETPAAVGTKVKLFGWVETKRDHGKLTFLDFRDRTGSVQCVGYKKLGEVTEQSVLEIIGTVKARPENMVNKDLETGAIEVDVEEYTILNKSKELPIPIDSEGYEIKEDVRLQFRYLDLRRKRLRDNIKLRSDLAFQIRQNLHTEEFTEVETPMLTKSTKEGSRDFVVPSRLQPGKFYALPQSPQQYKQLLMTAGVERYFQFARCIRDEDLRADRGFEHTQVDLEMSFVNQSEVMQMVEKIVIKSMEAVGCTIQKTPFPIFQYSDAIKQFGQDKFDLRTEEEKKTGVLAFAWVVGFPFFKKVDTSDIAEVRDGKSGWTFTHNPFSSPLAENEEDHITSKNIENIVTAQYDLVCNGYEVGGGSIRAHKPEVLRATFRTMGYSDQEIESGIGHMLQAFEVGTPPHGGIALGLDRLAMLAAGETSLREVIPFPMSSSGRTSVMVAPNYLEETQLEELELSVTTKSE